MHGLLAYYSGLLLAVLMGHQRVSGCDYWLGVFMSYEFKVNCLIAEIWANKPVAQLVLCSSGSWHGARCVACAVSRSGLVCSSSVRAERWYI